MSGLRKDLLCSVSAALRKKYFIICVDCDLFCWASQVNLGWWVGGIVWIYMKKKF